MDSFYKRKYKMQKVNWLLVGIISFVIILILFGTGVLLGEGRYQDWGTMGPIGMREDWGYSSPPSPFDWVGIIFMSLIPVGLIVLAIFGIIWLVRNLGNSKPPSA
jgi:hypothetical protein